MWYGLGRAFKTWATTPDGRERFQTLLLRRRVAVYPIDQPRPGGAARGSVGTTITATPDDQGGFNVFRLGPWPDFLPGVQLSREPAALEQLFRQGVPTPARR